MLSVLPAVFRPDLPVRARWLVQGALAFVASGFFIYLLGWEYNLAEWNPYGSPFNLLATGLLTAVLVSLLHLVSRRIWFSLTIGMALVLFLAAWSDLKFRMNGFSLTVVDLLIIDTASISFALKQPDFYWHLAGAALVALLAAALFLAERPSGAGFLRRATQCAVALTLLFGMLIYSFPGGAKQAMQVGSAYHVTVFTKSLLSLVDFFRHDGVLEKSMPGPDAPVLGATRCIAPEGLKRPHIVMIIDEASIDTTRIPGFPADPALSGHFTSFDGSRRSLRAETFGGGTWLTELSALTGLSTRSFGVFAPVATRMVATRVKHSLPAWLNECGYETRSIYPAGGRFNSARRMHEGLSVGSFEDWFDLKKLDPSLSDALQLRDEVYYRYATERIARAPQKPSFTFLWLTGNHTPWNEPLSPEVTVGGMPYHPDPRIAEYMRRQRLSDIDLRAFKADLARRFPAESFLIIRFGDHLPFNAGQMIDPQLSADAVWKKIDALDPVYFTTYLAVDTINYKPAAPMPETQIIAANALGLLLFRLTGLPPNPMAQYQATIFDRCNGLLVECENGDAMRRFNGWLSRNGVIEGL
jgi:hypothetical protein